MNIDPHLIERWLLGLLALFVILVAVVTAIQWFL